MNTIMSVVSFALWIRVCSSTYTGSLPCQPGESRTANVNLEGSILNWTNPFRYVVGGQGVLPYGAQDNELLKNYRIIAR